MWVAVVTIVFGDRLVQAQSGTDFPDQTARQVIITERALRHIEERHWPDSPAQGAGKFSEGITEDALRELDQRKRLPMDARGETPTDDPAKFTNTISADQSASRSMADRPASSESW